MAGGNEALQVNRALDGDQKGYVMHMYTTTASSNSATVEVTTTGTWTDIVDELRDLSQANGLTLDQRFTAIDAADYIELLRRRL